MQNGLFTQLCPAERAHFVPLFVIKICVVLVLSYDIWSRSVNIILSLSSSMSSLLLLLLISAAKTVAAAAAVAGSGVCK